ncbi:MAG TPA: TetR family transcriptional regulator C-terminal domain-containing protein [Candidatus Obscuribacterales bacterium]
MTAKTSTKQNTRALLLETGIDIMIEKGYHATGLSDVLSACGVPKGSFYHYFESKEDFGLQVINTFDEKYVAQLDQVLSDPKLSPLNRLKKYIDDAIAKAESRQCSRGCLIANLSQEMADQNEVFRLRLKQIITKRRESFARVIKEAQEDGEIAKDLDANELAEFFLSAFEGAIMRAKVQKDIQPFRAFKKMFFDKLCRHSQESRSK